MIEYIARQIAKQYYLGYNEGFCNAICDKFEGDVSHLVNKNWHRFIKIAENILTKVK